MTAREVLDQIGQRAAAATPGPWERHTAPRDRSVSKGEWLADTCRGDDPLQVLISASDDPQFAYLVPALTGDGPTSAANAEFIAHARDDVPALVAALRAVLDLHPRVQDVDARDEPGERYYALDGWWCGNPNCGIGTVRYPCENVRAITDALGADQ